MAAALALGAEGVWCGSIWLGTKESELSPEMKERFFAARSEDAIQRRVFIGKQLAEKLYVRYGQSTDQAYNVLQIIYQISTRWMVQAQSGTASSADIFYTIEH